MFVNIFRKSTYCKQAPGEVILWGSKAFFKDILSGWLYEGEKIKLLDSMENISIHVYKFEVNNKNFANQDGKSENWKRNKIKYQLKWKEKRKLAKGF